MSTQYTRDILMMRPYKFGANGETAKSNGFQTLQTDSDEIAQKAHQEFDEFVALLRKEGVRVALFQDDAFPNTPDAVFVNNWVSFHEDGRVVLYPMLAENRRGERREEILDILADDFGFSITDVEDFSGFETESLFLEGTGSMVLDRINLKAYAALSPRTDFEILETFCERFDYDPVTFDTNMSDGATEMPVYHTNVMLSIAPAFAMVCMQAIANDKDREKLKNALKNDGKKIIEITIAQMRAFCGNVLVVGNEQNELLCVMSSQAYESFRPDQLDAIAKHARVIHSPLNTIEKLGGGSARCMMAELFLPRINP